MPGTLKRQRTITASHQPGAIHTRFPSRSRTRPKSRNKTVTVPRNKLAFPQAIRTKLRYVERLAFEMQSATAPSSYQFRANNLYDPNYGAGGHQPRGFDQFMAQYGEYTVHGATISINSCQMYGFGPILDGTTVDKLQVYATSGEAQLPGCPGYTLAICKSAGPLPSLANDMVTYLETDRTKWLVVAPNEQAKVLHTSAKVADFYGTTGSLVGREGFVGIDGVASGPDNEVIFTVLCQQTGSDALIGSSSLKVFGVATIEYDVTFAEPKPLVAS